MNQTQPETQPAPQHVYRQRSPLVIAVLFGLGAVVLLGSAALSWRDHPQPLFVSWLVWGCAALWAVFVRPSVVLTPDGVRLSNIVREVRIPWSLVSDVEARWNVKVWAGDEGWTAWAISSQVERPKVASSLLPGMSTKLGPVRRPRRARAAGTAPAKAAKVTARAVADAIEDTSAEYAAAVDRGRDPAPAVPGRHDPLGPAGRARARPAVPGGRPLHPGLSRGRPSRRPGRPRGQGAVSSVIAARMRSSRAAASTRAAGRPARPATGTITSR